MTATADADFKGEMDNLTARLLKVKHRSGSPWTSRLREAAERLFAEYGLPRLGNFRDPVKEIFYILLSAKTTDAQYRATHRRLWQRFPRLEDLARANLRDIRACVASGGLAYKRGPQIRRTARALIAAGGHRPSQFIQRLEVESVYHFLSNLSGMGPKSALCVMMYSLNADALPVDANVQRIAERMGAIPPSLKHYQAQRRLAAIAPSGVCRTLHVGMVAHGRRICLPRKPKCGSCVLVDLCRRGRSWRSREELQHA